MLTITAEAFASFRSASAINDWSFGALRGPRPPRAATRPRLNMSGRVRFGVTCPIRGAQSDRLASEEEPSATDWSSRFSLERDVGDRSRCDKHAPAPFRAQSLRRTQD